jgi:hypothetical protein
MVDVPQHDRDRVVDPAFEPSEDLFRRCQLSDVDCELRPQVIGSVPRMSLNRGKYSKPKNVIHPNCCGGMDCAEWGIYTFTVGDVAAKVYENPQTKSRVRFSVVHTPEELCRAHSEIACHDADGGKPVARVAKTIRHQFKINLARLASWVQKPAGLETRS